MSNRHNEGPRRRRLSVAALGAGLSSLALMVVYFAALSGMTALIIISLVGLLAVVLGGIALRQLRPDGMALAGVIIGGVCALLGAAVILFALLFVGALSF